MRLAADGQILSVIAEFEVMWLLYVAGKERRNAND